MSIDRVSTAAQTAFFLSQIQNAGNALDNVIVGAYGAGFSDAEAIAAAAQALSRVGLADQAGVPAGQLTNKQLRLMELARALAGVFRAGELDGAADSRGNFVGSLRRPNGEPIKIDKLWALQFGGGAKSSPESLFFTAGPNDEANGLFGVINAVARGREHGG